MDIKDIIGFVLRFLIPIIGLVLIFVPLWWVGWKVEKKSWWHYFGAIPVMVVIFFVIEYLLSKMDRLIYNNIYNSHVVLDGITDGGLFLILISILFLTLSPYIYTKKLYQYFTIKNLIFPTLLAIVLFIVQSILFLYYMAYGLSKLNEYI